MIAHPRLGHLEGNPRILSREDCSRVYDDYEDLVRDVWLITEHQVFDHNRVFDKHLLFSCF